MEVKPGYKQTDIGALPEDWRVAKIKEVASITTGKRNTQDRIEDGLYPFFVRSQTVERINSFSFDGEAVLTAGDGVGTGKVFHYINGKFDFHQRVYKLSDFTAELNGFYFHLYFSTHFYDRIMSMTAKSSVDSVRLETIAGMQIPLPPLPEQRAIAGALSDVDALLGALDQLIAKKRDLKQAAMQQLLTGQTRLPGFHGEWEEKRLADILKVRHGKSQHGITAPDGKYPILASGGEIGRTNSYIYDKPSVLIGRKGTIDSPQYVDSPFWTVDTLFFTEISNEADAKFVFYKFTMIRWRSYNEASGVPSLNAKTIENIEIQIPPHVEQTAIAGVLTDLDLELAALEQRRAKTRALKQGMMQELLTGRVRLR
jgi:type I restriction enzyme S subunit